MRNLFSLLVVAILMGSTIAGVAAESSNTKTLVGYSFEINIDRNDIKITHSNNRLIIEIKNVSTYVMALKKPTIAKIVRVIELPFGVKNVSVDLRCSYETLKGNDSDISDNTDLYPSESYFYRVGVGLNKNFEHVTFVSIHWYPIRYSPSTNTIFVSERANVTITYEPPEKSPFPEKPTKDMVIIAPKKFAKPLQKLVDHKNSVGVRTFLKKVEDIYREYPGRDEPEKIKYFIKDAVEKYGIKYVLLVGGLKSTLYAKPKDNCNKGARWWYVPVRYNNLHDNPSFPLNIAFNENVDLSGEPLHDPGCLTDLYYADIYREGGEFEDWDPNGDGIFSAWGKPGVENDTDIDLYPDVIVGRLACRNIKEVKTVVNKIINYENSAYGTEWFKRIIAISGDGFLDQCDLNITWDTDGLPNGEYTLYAQSFTPDGRKGPKDTIHFILDRTKPTNITFNHDDHLNPALQNGYPAPPIAEIVSISPYNVLGYTDFFYTPSEREAYCNEIMPWADISYEDGVLTIRGKSYDPRPYGNCTNIHVWIKDWEGNVVFSAWRNNTEMYYEGEWVTGEKPLLYRGGALYYMPKNFERVILWASNGKLTGIKSVIDELNKGAGFVFLSGHGSPNVWADHYPGVPGNRRNGDVTGLQVTSIQPWKPFISFPLFPIDSLSNQEKLPVAVIGGCHNAMFNVSVIPTVYDLLPYIFKFLPKVYMWTFGNPVPECFCWRLVRNPHGGAIAAIGNTGLGYGIPGKECTVGGGDAWITIEFFRQYGEENIDILGLAHEQAITSYINNFDMRDFGAGHIKTVEQWILLGDPSLKIGGYPQIVE